MRAHNAVDIIASHFDLVEESGCKPTLTVAAVDD
jgi:hypothetical protein